MTENGFDDLLIIPGGIPLIEIKDKMSMEKGYWESDNFKKGGSFAGAVSKNVDKTRIILIHKTQELDNRPELEVTLNTKGEDIKFDQTLTLEGYIIFQRKYFADTGKHLDEQRYVWLATNSGARLVISYWLIGDNRLDVGVDGINYQGSNLGVRFARSFF